MQANNRVTWAKIESTYGTDSTPASTDSIITTGASIQRYNGNFVQVDIDEPTAGGKKQINTGPFAQLQAGVFLQGSGTAGTAPYWGPLMRACAFSETEDAGVDVVYQPVSTGYESVTIYDNTDGERQVMVGSRGSVSFTMGRGQLPLLNFDLIGFYARPTTQSMSLDKSAFVDPIPVTKVNTPTVTLDGYAAKLESFSININNNHSYRNGPNFEEVTIGDKQPDGRIAIQAPTIATKDMFALLESHNGVTTSILQIVQGTSAGKIATVDCPAVQLSNMSETESDGILIYEYDVQFINSSAGDDFFKLTLT